jgi:hypothetical protein
LDPTSAEFVPAAATPASHSEHTMFDATVSPYGPSSECDEDYFIPSDPVFEWLLYETEDTVSDPGSYWIPPDSSAFELASDEETEVEEAPLPSPHPGFGAAGSGLDDAVCISPSLNLPSLAANRSATVV